MVGAAPVIGLAHGLLVTKLRLQPFLVTLCGLFIYRGLARWLSQLAGTGTVSGGGHTLTVAIPSTPAQQYPAGTYNGLVDLTTNLWVKGGKSVVHSTGCPSSLAS